MRKYQITGYIEYALPFSFEVEASSVKEAQKMAEEEAPNHDFQRDAERSDIIIDKPQLNRD